MIRGPRRLRGPTGSNGFTLLELLVALALVAILAAIQTVPFQRTIITRDRAQEVMEESQTLRVIVQRLAEELSGAVPAQDPAGEFSVADRTLDFPVSELVFSTTGASRLRAGPRDPVEVVRYFVETSIDGEPRLIKEQRPSVADPASPPLRVVLLRGIHTFRITVQPRGVRDWLPTWTAEAGRRLPRAVGLEVSLRPATEAPPMRLVLTLPRERRS